MELATDQVQEAFLEAIAETMENMAFMEVLPGSADQETEFTEAVLFTRLPIYQPVRSVVGLVTPVSLCIETATSILGRDLDAEEDEFEIRDAMNEIVNTLAGSLFTNLMPDTESFELGLPETRLLEVADPDKEFGSAALFSYEINGVALMGLWEG